MDTRQYQNEQIEDRQDAGEGIQPQIFYKKDDSKIIYSESQETYRGPQEHQYD